MAQKPDRQKTTKRIRYLKDEQTKDSWWVKAIGGMKRLIQKCCHSPKGSGIKGYTDKSGTAKSQNVSKVAGQGEKAYHKSREQKIYPLKVDQIIIAKDGFSKARSKRPSSKSKYLVKVKDPPLP